MKAAVAKQKVYFVTHCLDQCAEYTQQQDTLDEFDTNLYQHTERAYKLKKLAQFGNFKYNCEGLNSFEISLIYTTKLPIQTIRNVKPLPCK